MKRWILKSGSTTLDGLLMEDAAKPQPGPGEVRVKVHSVSLKYRDQFIIQGGFWRTEKELVPVADGAGEIDALGAGVDSLTYAEASTLPCAAVTAWSALFGANPISPNSSVLIVGTGGVSLFSAHLAVSAGARVFAVTSEDAKRQRLLDLGVSEVVNYKTTPEWGNAIFQLTGGVDKVVDAAGSLNQSLAALRPAGEVAMMGLITNDGAPNPMTLMAKALTIRGISVGNADAYNALAESIQNSGNKPIIARTFRFDEAKEAYAAQVAPDVFGKIVIEVPA